MFLVKLCGVSVDGTLLSVASPLCDLLWYNGCIFIQKLGTLQLGMGMARNFNVFYSICVVLYSLRKYWKFPPWVPLSLKLVYGNGGWIHWELMVCRIMALFRFRTAHSFWNTHRHTHLLCVLSCFPVMLFCTVYFVAWNFIIFCLVALGADWKKKKVEVNEKRIKMQITVEL